MKLARLLGLGSSFFGGRQMAAYRLNNRGWLPKFNEGRNPFAPAAPAAAAVEAEASQAQAQAPAVVAGPKPPAPYAFKPKPLAKAGSSGSQIKRELPTTGASAKAARPSWTTRLNPFRAPEPAAANPPPEVQPELSLAAIKVLHNDLADADVEIVPVKSHGCLPTPAVLPPARQAWEYVGESLLKSS